MARISAGVATSHVPAIGAASMTGMSTEDYREMMLSGGRSIEGNLYTEDDDDGQN